MTLITRHYCTFAGDCAFSDLEFSSFFKSMFSKKTLQRSAEDHPQTITIATDRQLISTPARFPRRWWPAIAIASSRRLIFLARREVHRAAPAVRSVPKGQLPFLVRRCANVALWDTTVLPSPIRSSSFFKWPPGTWSCPGFVFRRPRRRRY